LVLELLAHRPDGHGTQLTAGLEFASKVLRQRSVIFLVSDFLTETTADAGLEHALRRLSAGHDVVPIRLRDPANAELPAVGMLAVVDPESGARTVVNTSRRSVREAHRTRFQRQHERISAILRGASLDVVEIDSRSDYVPPLVALFRRRSRSGA
jgi:hypothetical protein